MADIFRREYKELEESQIQAVADIKVKAQELFDLLGSVESKGVANREIENAKEKLEECVMWATKAATA